MVRLSPLVNFLRRGAWPVLAASFALMTPAVSADVEQPSPEYVKAMRELDQRLANASGARERALTLMRIAAFEKPQGVMKQVVHDYVLRDAIGYPPILQKVFFEADEEARLMILQMYYDEWNVLGRGTDPWRLVLVRQGLMSENTELRRAAARLAAERPFPRAGNELVDATTWDSSLRLAALLGIALNADWRPVRWVVSNLDQDDPTILQATHRAIWRIGRRAAPHLHDRITGGTADQQRRALEALLLIATEEDSTVLYRWLESGADPADELTKKVSAALASIEIGNYAADTPTRPKLTFDLADASGR